MGDQVEMVVKVHCGTVFQRGDKFIPQNSLTLHFDYHLDLVSCATSSGELEDVINLAHGLNALMYANKSQLNSINMRKQSCYSIT